MGNPTNSGALANAAPISRFYSQNTWIDGKAEDQITTLSKMEGLKQIAAFPDLHPGKYGPVGCAILSDLLYPLLVGNDIGCGMALFVLDIPARKLRADKVANRLRALEGHMEGGTMGTIGGGNHFCEVQTVASIHCEVPEVAKGSTLLLVHSGSRNIGEAVFERHAAGAAAGLQGEAAQAYMVAHDMAVEWAAQNRMAIAERAAKALRVDFKLLCDAPHNLVEATAEGWLHRKGAAKGSAALVPLAGSRDAPSYLLQSTGRREALSSLAHGAGRKFERRSMKGRVGKADNLTRTQYGGRVVCG